MIYIDTEQNIKQYSSSIKEVIMSSSVHSKLLISQCWSSRYFPSSPRVACHSFADSKVGQQSATTDTIQINKLFSAIIQAMVAEAWPGEYQSDRTKDSAVGDELDGRMCQGMVGMWRPRQVSVRMLGQV